MMKQQWFGQAGHFIAADSCLFHLHTHVGGWCISTVGEWFPRFESTDGPVEIGSGCLYETMVFRLDANGNTNGHAEDFVAYNSRYTANEGHARMVEKWGKP